MKLTRRTFLATASTFLVAAPHVARARTHKLKLSHYLPPRHQMHRELSRWTDELRKLSNGNLDIEIFPAGQMGPPPRQYDLTRTGVADISFIFTAFSPGRFKKTDVLGLPFVLADDNGDTISTSQASWLGTSMKSTFKSEFVGTEPLYLISSTSTGFFMREKMIRKPADLKGLRVRPTSAIVADQLRALGASPASVSPVELSDAIAKGVVDGAIFNFEGGKVFQLHRAVKKVSQLSNSVGTFAVVMNSKSLTGLPNELQKMIHETTGPEAAKRVGKHYDTAEAAGKKFFIENGVEVHALRGGELAPFREALAPAAAKQLAAVDAAGHDSKAIVAEIKRLRAKV